MSFEDWVKSVDLEADDIKTDVEQHLQKVRKGYDEYDGEKNAQVLWRLARALYKMAAAAENAKDMERMKKFLLEGDETIGKALKLNNEDADIHSWAAFLSGKISEISSVKEKILRGHRVKEHLDEAVKLRPNDAGLFYTLGRWSIEVAKLNFIERKLAATFFAEPPTATYQDAIDNFNKALQCKPDGRACYYHRAVCQIALKKYKECIESIDLAVKCTPRDEEDVLVEKSMYALQEKYAKYR